MSLRLTLLFISAAIGVKERIGQAGTKGVDDLGAFKRDGKVGCGETTKPAGDMT